MANQEPQCGICGEILRIACTEIKKPEFCTIRDRYQEHGLAPDDVMFEMSKIETPQDHEFISERLVEMGLARR